MSSQDTIDAAYIYTVTNNTQFQERCWLRFIIAAFSVAGEFITGTVTAVTAAGNNTLTFSSTPASITGLVASNITLALPANPPSVPPLSTIPVGTKVASVTATTAVLDHNVIGIGVSIGDNISFAPPFHAEKVRFSGALFSKTVDWVLLSNSVLAGSTNRTNCLADRSIPGGNVTDAGIDSQVAAVFTGLAISKSW